MRGLVPLTARKPRTDPKTYAKLLTLQQFKSRKAEETKMRDDQQTMEPPSVMIGSEFRGKQIVMTPAKGFRYGD